MPITPKRAAAHARLLLCALLMTPAMILNQAHATDTAFGQADDPMTSTQDQSNDQSDDSFDDSFDGSGKVEIVLVASEPYIVPGEPIILSPRLIVDPDWHIYWPGLNDTGYGTSVSIDPVEGLEIGETVWPSPERYLAPGGILDHVYEDRTKLLIPVETSENLEIGTTLSITLNVDFLVCKDVCLPGSGEYTLELPVIDGTKRPILSMRQQKVRGFYASRPTMLDLDAVVWKGNSAKIEIDDARKYEFFPGEDCSPIEDLIRTGEQNSRRMTLDFEPDEDSGARLQGRLRVQLRDLRVIEFDLDHEPS